MKPIHPVASCSWLLALAALIPCAPAMQSSVACGSSCTDDEIPEKGYSSGVGGSPTEAYDNLAKNTAVAECEPCTGSGCKLGMDNGAQGLNTGQGGAISISSSNGVDTIGVRWGTGSSIDVKCSACE